MKHTNNLQHFALDINNNIIDINDTEISNNQQYFCPHCHNEMIAKQGDIRQWHFAHKTDKCSYDKYLHSIAEIMIMNWFTKEEHILLSMNGKTKCDKYDNCIFYNQTNCKRTERHQYDLKKYYSKCLQEHWYNGFIADLFCENKTDLLSPIFIEIHVTHKCSQEKINSGIRIIEITINSEEDIINIINSKKLNESNNIKLYNFKRKESLSNNFKHPFQKYILYNTFKSYIDRDSFTCKNYHQHRKGIYEISMPYDECIPTFYNCGSLYAVGKVKAYIDGFLKKDCQLCKWQREDMFGDKLCILYKKCGNPKYCKDNEASKCSMFKENTEFINLAVSDFTAHFKKEIVDIWHIDTP